MDYQGRTAFSFIFCFYLFHTSYRFTFITFFDDFSCRYKFFVCIDGDISYLNVLTADDKSGHHLSKFACTLWWSYFLSCKPSDYLTPTTLSIASGDNNRGYGLTHYVHLLWGSIGWIQVQVAALYIFKRERGMRAPLFLTYRWASLPGPRCSGMESMPFPVPLDAEWLLEVVSCSLAIDSMTRDFMTKALTRAGFLRADKEMCLPLVFTLT